MNILEAGLTPKMAPLSAKKTKHICVLDIGTSKITALVAKLKPSDPSEVLPSRTHKIEVLGFGHVQSKGVKSGVVVNIEEAESAIRLAVSEAERQADLTVDKVIVAVSAGRLTSHTWHSSVDITNERVENSDLHSLMQKASLASMGEGRSALHSLPTSFTLDNESGITEPRGMIGKNLGVDMHLVTLDSMVAQNLMLAVERAHLSVEAMVASPYASGLSTLTDDELETGTLLIDFGAGTTTFAVFDNGKLLHADGFSIGSRHITLDIARGLSCRMSEAERVKVLHGGVVTCASDAREIIRIKTVGDDEHDYPRDITRANVIDIIRPRVDEIIEMVLARLEKHPVALAAGKRIVITGGGALLTGLSELTAKQFKRPVRIGRPVGINNLPANAKTGHFATLTGLCLYPQMAGLEHFEVQIPQGSLKKASGSFRKTLGWLKESF